MAASWGLGWERDNDWGNNLMTEKTPPCPGLFPATGAMFRGHRGHVRGPRGLGGNWGPLVTSPPMDLHDSPGDAAFRGEARGWLEENLVGAFAGARGLGRVGNEHEGREIRVAWERKLGEDGWTC